jgi:type VI secretion system protein ImpC
MAERTSRSSVLLDVNAGTQAEPAAVTDSDHPFQILVIGNFSGQNRGGPWRVDADVIDSVLSDMEVTLEVPGAILRFDELEDFHPDSIYQQLGSGRMEAAAPASTATDREIGKGLLESLLSGGALSETQEAEVQQPDAGEQMRSILHDPRFQALEAGWRGIWMLVRRLQPDADVRVYLWDTIAPALPDAAALAKRGPWSLVIGNFAFGQSAAEARRLEALGQVASSMDAPFVAEGLPPDPDATAPEWRALRRSDLASWLGLVTPRVLLRLPYGRETSPIESFPFEEMPKSVHEHYLWGNPALCCAIVLGEAHRNNGREDRKITGVPLHVYRVKGEAVAKPCAEVLLGESDTEFLIEQGVMPLASVRDVDEVILVRLQSIADPPARLAGRWR